jgi:dihydrofolate synthase / folylpolyglutamate synthase
VYAADSRHSRPSLQDKLQYLYTLRSGPAIDLTIRPDYYELLNRLGDPHKKLPPVIHVAGTNGKGSTIATLRAILEAAGYKVHAYTSPHLRRFNERIVLAGREIGDDALEYLLDEVTAASRGLSLTFFEITTALTFTAFARQPATIALVETGLGGRLDCTNVIEKPLATIITAIGFDHQEFLGDTLPQIAAEKAGIMKRGVPCVISPQAEPAVNAVFAVRAAELGCRLWRGGAEWRAAARDGQMIFTCGEKRLTLPLPSLAGPHQIDNAGAALTCLQIIKGFDVPTEALTEGLRHIHWPARLQRLPDPAPGWELWLDGAHNENGAHALAGQMEQWRKQDGKNLHLVFGIMQRKDAAAFLKHLLPGTASVTAVGIAGEPLAHTADTLAAALKNTSLLAPAFVADPRQAIRQIAAIGPPGRILIAGSLYLAGQMLSEQEVSQG